ncbi:MAG: hypothetical protein AAF571_10330 [Verrucomicrobiota bacterium]
MDPFESLEMRVQAAPWKRGYDLYLMDRESKTIAKDVVFEKVEEGYVRPPTLTVSETSAQTLMDDLWASGVRPTEGAGSAGAMRATEKHLSDMRAIVSDKLKVKL